MKYENGKTLFPPELLREIQKYVSGRLVYIPSADRKRSWGETSGYRQYLLERNCDIREKFRRGERIEDLADAYFLSTESVRKIIYAKKEEPTMHVKKEEPALHEKQERPTLQYHDTCASAREYAEAGRLEEWVHLYLLSDGHNQPFSEGLKIVDRYYLGPVRMPLSLLHRCCGPEEDMKWRVEREWFYKHVTELEEVIKSGADLPPLIVHYYMDDAHKEGAFELNDGNHRFEAYTRLGIKTHDVILWITEKHEYDAFKAKYADDFAQ